MKSAYIYVRVSTDEQRRQGYSLVEKEERLLKHCEINNIAAKVIFREDYSAKDFNRPEWKKLLNLSRRKKAGLRKMFYFLSGTDLVGALNTPTR
jgi:DNA invertase Pin-like site-specific DNA recombinase